MKKTIRNDEKINLPIIIKQFFDRRVEKRSLSGAKTRLFKEVYRKNAQSDGKFIFFSFLSLFLMIYSIVLNGQITNETNTVGLLFSEPDKVSEGYVLFTPIGSTKAYLINNCGLVVNQWTFEGFSNFSGCYLLEDGSIIKLILIGDYYYGTAAYGNACFEHRSWNNDLIWRYCPPPGRYEGLHSDFHVLPNGNVIALVQDYHTAAEAILAGYDPLRLDNELKLESVVEFKPMGLDRAEIVWEWNLWDHLIQDYDESKSNYGQIEAHPRRFDINLVDDNSHFNSIDYNEKLDQIVVSSWLDSEIFIIDHSTTTEEAADSIGGKYGLGGDFLFRWGNAANYKSGEAQTLFGQHNPRWIPNSYGRFGGMISIFNNEYESVYSPMPKSAVVVINPDANGDGVYDMSLNKTFLPDTYEYIWTGDVLGKPLFSSIMSGAKVLSSGHIIICEAESGRLVEVDTMGNVVWVYKSPEGGGYEIKSVIVKQGVDGGGGIYKLEKYGSSYKGLANRALCGTKTLENENELTEACADYWKPNVAFLHSINGAEVRFNSISKNPDSLMWDFGDGQTSNEEKPDHIYRQPGIYAACLSGNNCYGSSTFCDTIEITVTDVSHYVTDKFNTFPNPVKDWLNFNENLPNQIATIYNAQGIQQKTIQLKNRKSINLQFLATGIYFIKFHSNLKRESIITKVYKT